MKKSTLFGLFSLLICFCFAQNAPLSPQVSSAEGLFQTDIYSGAPQVSIPIYNFKAKDLSVPITLFYSAGNGIKVNEEAGWVGTGWHLQAGGFVAQIIRGFDDFNTNGYYANRSKNLPCLEGSHLMPLSTQEQKDCFGDATNLSIADLDNYDLEPDLFILSLGGVNIKFFYDKKWHVFSSDPTEIKITYVETQGFTVELQDGNIYYFTVKEAAVDLNTTNSNYTNQGSTWYLSAISSYKTLEHIDLFYTTPLANDPKMTQTVCNQTIHTSVANTANMTGFYNDFFSLTNVFLNTVTCTGSPSFLLKPGDCSQYETALNAVQSKTISRNPIYLTRIVSSMGRIEFNTSSRGDINSASAKKLDEIIIYDNEGPIMRYQFLTDYFNSDPLSNPSNSYFRLSNESTIGRRLKLTSIQQKSGDGLKSMPPYVFAYIEGTNQPNLPYKTSYDVDHWGYYNYLAPSNHNTSLVTIGMTGIIKSSITDRAKAGMLFNYKIPIWKLL